MAAGRNGYPERTLKGREACCCAVDGHAEATLAGVSHPLVLVDDLNRPV